MNYIKSLSLIMFISCLQRADAQVTIMPGSTFTVLMGTTLTLPQNLTVQAGGTLNSDGFIQMQGGSFYDSGSAIFTNNAQLIFNGSTSQNIFSHAPVTISNLVLSNPTGLAPTASVTITNSLLMTSGNYFADTTHPIYFSDTATNPAETNSSRIIGRAVMTPRSIGTNPLSFLGCNISFGVDIGQVTIARTSGPNAILNVGPGYSIAQNWLVSSTNNQVTPNRNLSFSWLSAVDNGRDMTAMYLYGRVLPAANFLAMNDTATNVSATDPRVYFRPNINRFGVLYTLSDNKPLSTRNIPSLSTATVSGYPNPFSNELNLNITKNDNLPVQVMVVDIAGHVVLNNTYNAGTNTAITLNEMSKLSAGTYLLRVYNDNFAKALKIVKTN